ncbi:hypothetical protein JX265_007471 [Neoarthrinium moseri]|uniref:feruloyl esterase n=1 Tax=Neoarthrinium moseri TaxID=1658444 RepID=A0A9P9WKC7_9PEZI|nr:uncharacterized protein JN550_009827 [Neoarthrinium moseri]KAI1863091.1 hypothetical protein JN550_009827 [Neoarthrinium moseri]KAI1867669.1 hypothetical protein JX265_007471 [Neoarthrinium moseri]
MRLSTFPAVLAALGRLTYAASSQGCNKTSAAPTLEKRVTVELAANKSRSFMYWLPPNYDPKTPAPIIISYHGVRQSPTKQANLDQFDNTRFNTDMIAVYPQAVTPPGSDEVMWQGPRKATQDDIGFTMEILDQLEEEFCVDTDRIYASGKSEGAGFVGMLACNSTSNARIAAFAPVSGAFYPGHNDGMSDKCKDEVPVPCSPMRCNIPFLEFHGGADFLAPIEGGLHRHECLPDIRTYMRQWAQRDKLDTEPTEVYNLTDVAQVNKYDDKGTVTFVYDGDKVGHDWPWTVENPDTKRAHSKPASFNATSYIMEWFGNFTLAPPDNCNATV